MTEPLKSIDQYESELRRREVERRAEAEARRHSGIACPQCGAELMWTGRTVHYADVDQTVVEEATCSACGHTQVLRR